MQDLSDPVSAPDTPAHSRVTRLLTAVEHTLDQHADDSLPVDIDQLLAEHSRAHHGGHCVAVHTEVRDALALLGVRGPFTGAELLREIRTVLRLLGGA